MADVIITGASRGIGQALARALAGPGRRLFLSARDGEALASLSREIASQGGEALPFPADLCDRDQADALGRRLGELVEPGATLVHNAGVWPQERRIVKGGLEASFALNHIGGLAVQRPLIASGRIARVMTVSAGLIVKGRFDPARTPTGADFSRWRTYATTKLCFAVAMRDEAARHPEIDFVVLHPGVVRTDLGASDGLLGALLGWIKRRWEAPEVCAARLARVLERQRWSPPGEARWLFEERDMPWPAPADDPRVRDDVRAVTARLFAGE
ncbi:MAG: SDR family NAD(P)-dependent oxidoreductase [Myxococcales bacterium]|nr:SDR family NAD(P)-dependent oxidoreductase [Myxococcales bacterium]